MKEWQAHRTGGHGRQARKGSERRLTFPWWTKHLSSKCEASRRADTVPVDQGSLEMALRPNVSLLKINNQKKKKR